MSSILAAPSFRTFPCHLNSEPMLLLPFSSFTLGVQDQPSIKSASGSASPWIVLLLPGTVLSHPPLALHSDYFKPSLSVPSSTLPHYHAHSRYLPSYSTKANSTSRGKFASLFSHCASTVFVEFTYFLPHYYNSVKHNSILTSYLRTTHLFVFYMSLLYPQGWYLFPDCYSHDFYFKRDRKSVV